MHALPFCLRLEAEQNHMEAQQKQQNFRIARVLAGLRGDVQRSVKDDAAVQLLGSALPAADKSYAIDAYSTDSSFSARKLRMHHQVNAVSDMPPNAAALPACAVGSRVSVPLPFVEPMYAGGPSARQVEEYQRTLIGESMSINGHLAFNGSAKHAPVPSNMATDAAASLRAYVHAACPYFDECAPDALLDPQTVLLPHATLSGKPKQATAAVAETRFSEFDAHTFRQHYDAAGRLAAGTDEASPDEMSGSNSDAPTAVMQLIPQHTHGALQRMRRTLAGIRHGADDADDGAAAAQQVLPAAAAAAAARPHFSARTKELIGSLHALRAGLQHLEQHRRVRTSELNRDPADADHLVWARSAPPGFASPFPQ